MTATLKVIKLIRLSDGSFMNHHRNVMINGERGEGAAYHYSGEAAEVLALVVKHSNPEIPAR